MTPEIVSGLVVVVVGAAVIGIVKASMNGMVLELQKQFVTRIECTKEHNHLAEEREDVRKDIQNHETRLNSVGA
jgi:hypothetical protein